ncbi:MAG: hypothetical protein ISP40_10480, partial [Alphaproteobacteria bacterium]|nr:hypothetical protein [Alphaproteobacteria bacterium]
MRLGNVTFIAVVIGLIWGGIWMVLTSLMMMLVTGLIVVPNIGIAALVGAGAALGVLLLTAEVRGRNSLGSIAGMAAVAVILLTGGQPFSLPLDKALITQIIALIIWSILSVASLALCLQGYVAGSAKR